MWKNISWKHFKFVLNFNDRLWICTENIEFWSINVGRPIIQTCWNMCQLCPIYPSLEIRGPSVTPCHGCWTMSGRKERPQRNKNSKRKWEDKNSAYWVKKGKKAQWNCLTRQPHLPFPVGSKTAKTKKTYKNKSTKTHYKKDINREEKTKRTYFYALLSIKKR